MITPDLELENMTLKLRDAFRVFAWEMYKVSYSPHYTPDILYTRFYSLWKRSRVAEMDFFQLEALAIKKGFSIEELLTRRACYYGICNE